MQRTLHKFTTCLWFESNAEEAMKQHARSNRTQHGRLFWAFANVVSILFQQEIAADRQTGNQQQVGSANPY